MPRLIWSVGAPAAVALLTATAWLNLRRSDPPSGLAPMEVVRFTSYPGIEKDPALSPDGKQIAFVWDGEKRDNFDVYVQLISGGPPLGLTSDPRPDVSPAWSPDGTQIAFARLSEGESNIYLIPSLGGRERKLTEMYSIWSEGKALDWSPDGKLLVAAGKTSPQDPYGLFLIALEDGRKRRLTSAPIQVEGSSIRAFPPMGRLWLSTELLRALYILCLLPEVSPDSSLPATGPREVLGVRTARKSSTSQRVEAHPNCREYQLTVGSSNGWRSARTGISLLFLGGQTGWPTSSRSTTPISGELRYRTREARGPALPS